MPDIEILHLPLVQKTSAELPSHSGRDPRFHLAIALIGSIALLANSQLLFQAATFALLFAGLVWWRLPIARIGKTILPVLLMMGLTLGYHLLFFSSTQSESGSTQLFSSAALDRGLFFAFRLGGLYLMIAQMILSVSSDALVIALTFCIRPFRHAGLPITPVVLSLQAAGSSRPALSRNVQDLHDSVRLSRPKRPTQFRRFRGRLNNYSQLLAPLLVLIMRRADHLILAIRARGYRPGQSMTCSSSLTWTWRDSIEGVVFAGMFVVLWIITAVPAK